MRISSGMRSSWKVEGYLSSDWLSSNIFSLYFLVFEIKVGYLKRSLTDK